MSTGGTRNGSSVEGPSRFRWFGSAKAIGPIGPVVQAPTSALAAPARKMRLSSKLTSNAAPACPQTPAREKVREARQAILSEKSKQKQFGKCRSKKRAHDRCTWATHCRNAPSLRWLAFPRSPRGAVPSRKPTCSIYSAACGSRESSGGSPQPDKTARLGELL